MAASPLISVVIPCYNHARFLREAVESIGVPSRPVEIVIVDDGSTDESAAVAEECRQAAEGTSFLIVRQANAGVSAARNRGLRESRGEYVVFLDSDDHLATHALEIGSRALDEHPEAVFAYGRCRMMAADGTLLATPQPPRNNRSAYCELLRQNCIWTTANVMFRRAPLERYGAFDPARDGSADYELYLRLARTNPIHDHGQVVAHYRRHQTNMSNNAAHMLRDMLEVLRSHRPYVDGDPQAMAAFREGWRNWQELYGTHLMNEIRAHVRDGEWVDAVRKTAILAKFHPRGLAEHTRRTFRRRSRALSAAS